MTCRRLPDNPPAKYGPMGSGHRILRALAAQQGCAVSRYDLQHLADIPRRKGFGFTLEQMVIDRLIRHQDIGTYEITFLGVHALSELEAGRTYFGTHPTRSGGRQPSERCAEPQPSVRIFAQREPA